MATSEIDESRTRNNNVWTFMSDEARDRIKIRLKSVGSRVMAATVISKRTLARIIRGKGS
jgi:uncharacterized protein YlaI